MPNQEKLRLLHGAVIRHKRHGFSTMLIASGENVKVVHELMRHANWTLEIYSQPRIQAKRNALHRVVEMIFPQEREVTGKEEPTGLPKYLEIRGSGIFNGTENGTETQRWLLIFHMAPRCKWRHHRSTLSLLFHTGENLCEVVIEFAGAERGI